MEGHSNGDKDYSEDDLVGVSAHVKENEHSHINADDEAYTSRDHDADDTHRVTSNDDCDHEMPLDSIQLEQGRQLHVQQNGVSAFSVPIPNDIGNKCDQPQDILIPDRLIPVEPCFDNQQHPCSTSDYSDNTNRNPCDVKPNDAPSGPFKSEDEQERDSDLESDHDKAQDYRAASLTNSTQFRRVQIKEIVPTNSEGCPGHVTDLSSKTNETCNLCPIQGYSLAYLLKSQGENAEISKENEAYALDDTAEGFEDTDNSLQTPCSTVDTSPEKCPKDLHVSSHSNIENVTLTSSLDAATSTQENTICSSDIALPENTIATPRLKETQHAGDVSASGNDSEPCIHVEDNHSRENDLTPECESGNSQNATSSLCDGEIHIHVHPPTSVKPPNSVVNVKVRSSPGDEIGPLCDSASDFVPVTVKQEPVDNVARFSPGSRRISPGRLSTSPSARRLRQRNSPKQFIGKPVNFLNMEVKRLETLLRPKAKRKRSSSIGTKVPTPTPQQEESSPTTLHEESNGNDSPQGNNDAESKSRKAKKSGQPVLVFHQVIPPRPRAPMRGGTPPESSSGLISSMLRNIAEQIQEPNTADQTTAPANTDPDTRELQHQQPLLQVPPNSHRPQISTPVQPGFRRRPQLRFSDYSNWFTSQSYLSRQGPNKQSDESGFSAWKRGKRSDENLPDQQRHPSWTNWPANTDDRLRGGHRIHPIGGSLGQVGASTVRELLQRPNEAGPSASEMSRLSEALRPNSNRVGSGVGVVPTATVAGVVGSSNYSFSHGQQDILRQYLTSHVELPTSTCQNITSATIPTSVMDSQPVMTTQVHVEDRAPARQVRTFRWAQSSHPQPDPPNPARKRIRLIADESRHSPPASLADEISSNHSAESSSSHRAVLSLNRDPQQVPVEDQPDIKPDIKTLANYKYPSVSSTSTRPSETNTSKANTNTNSLIRHLLVQGTSSVSSNYWEPRMQTSSSTNEHPKPDLSHGISAADAVPQPGSSSGTEEETKSNVPVKRDSFSHVDLDTGQTQTTSYTCEHCDVIFSDSVMYILHMGCHGRRSAFECNQCGAVFRDKFEFTIHFIQGEHSPK